MHKGRSVAPIEWERITSTLEEAITLLTDTDKISKLSTLVTYERKGNAVRFRLEDIIALAGSSGGLLKVLTDVNGLIKVNTAVQSDIEVTTSAPADNTDASFTVPPGETHEILGSVAAFAVDNTVSTRQANLQITPTSPIVLTTAGITQRTPDIALTADQEASMLFMENAHYFQSDNGARSVVTDEAPFHGHLDGGGLIEAVISANKQTADRSGLIIIHQRVR